MTSVEPQSFKNSRVIYDSYSSEDVNSHVAT